MRKRNHLIRFRLDDTEHAKFLEDVEKTGLTQQAFLKLLVSGYAPKEKPPPDYYAMTTELRRVGNNLNQIARAIHTTGLFDPSEYDENAKLYRETLREITKATIEPERRRKLWQ